MRFASPDGQAVRDFPKNRVVLASGVEAGHTGEPAAPVTHSMANLQMCCPAASAKSAGKFPTGKLLVFKARPPERQLLQQKKVGVTI